MSTKDKGRKWDGKSRVSNDLYRKNYNKIFQKIEDPFKKEQQELNESSVKGYYADVTLENHSNKRAELFAISSDVVPSSK